MLLRLMAKETSRFNAEVLDTLAPHDGERILEIGFGHGQTLLDAARRAPGAHFAGIDVSATAERAASRRCRTLIDARQLDLAVGDAGAMPWDASTFDAAFSVHTIYFWARPAGPLAEVRRVLRPGGRFVLGMRERSDAALASFPAHTYRFYSNGEVAQLCRDAGFDEVEVLPATAGPDLRVVVARKLAS
jgi:ubiquinone/menaquinone biosynthesis C-methylase UbiE